MIELKDRGAWFGDPLLKDRTVALMKRHRELDHFYQGLYQAMPGSPEFKGCAVGCLVQTSKLGWMSDSQLGLYFDGTDRNEGLWHLAVEEQFGIPAYVAAQIDNLFEHQDNFQDAGKFAVAVVEAISVGADLSGIGGGDHECTIEGLCLACSVIDDWYDDTNLFVQALANAPLVPAARALILVG
jgi:hypothetical protein